MTPESDLLLILAVAKAECDGRKIQYLPALQRAYAQTLTYMAEHWEPRNEAAAVEKIRRVSVAKERASDG